MKLYPFSLDYNPSVNFDFTDFLNVSFEVLLQVLVISMPCLLSWMDSWFSGMILNDEEKYNTDLHTC